MLPIASVALLTCAGQAHMMKPMGTAHSSTRVNCCCHPCAHSAVQFTCVMSHILRDHGHAEGVKSLASLIVRWSVDSKA